jgi:hypothetical protein
LGWLSQRSMTGSGRDFLSAWQLPGLSLARGCHLGKGLECPTIKTSLRGPFVVFLSIPIAVKVAEIAPWIHYSWVKPASLSWECIPYLGSPCRITLGNVSALPRQDSTIWGNNVTMNNKTTAQL